MTRASESGVRNPHAADRRDAVGGFPFRSRSGAVPAVLAGGVAVLLSLALGRAQAPVPPAPGAGSPNGPPRPVPGVTPAWSRGGTPATNMPIKALDGGRWQVGEVVLDQRERTVKFPAVVNMDHAAVEYLLVAASGKVHESVLRTEARPFDVHIAVLLLGAKAASTSDPAIFYDPRQKVPGDPVDIELKWENEGRTVTRAAEEFVVNLETKALLSRGPWAYNGSQIVDGRFVAQQEGSIIALMADPYALINNPRIGHENDEIWRIATNAIPPLGTPVEVTIRLK